MKKKIYEDLIKEKTNKKIDDVNKQFEQGLIDDEEHLFKLEHINRLKNETDFIKKLDDIYFFAYKHHLVSFFLCDVLEKTKKIVRDENITDKIQKINYVFDEVLDLWTNDTDLKMMGF